MLRQKIKISTTGDDAIINIDLKSEYMLGDLSQDIDNLITKETDGSINDTFDEEKLRFMPSTNYSMIANFYSTGSTSYVTNVAPNEFVSSATTSSAFVNSFYIFKVFDSTQENIQNLLHTSYLNGNNFIGFSSNGYPWNLNYEYGDVHIPYSFLDPITANTVNLYAKLFFYSGKSGKVYPFSKNDPTTGGSEADQYNTLTLNRTTKRYTVTTPFSFYEITNPIYVDLVNDSVDSIGIEKPTYPSGNTFTIDGQYVTVG